MRRDDERRREKEGGRSLTSHRRPWNLMEPQGNPQRTMELHGMSWNFMEESWKSHDRALGPVGKSQHSLMDFMETHRSPWNIYDIIPWNTLETHGTREADLENILGTNQESVELSSHHVT
jgi:hypothetical protein